MQTFFNNRFLKRNHHHFEDMSMNLIEHLSRTVTPILLGNQTHNDNQASLLEKVYAIFIARLADTDTYQAFDNVNIDNEDSSFFERLIPQQHQHDMVQELSQQYNTPVPETQSLITRSAPLVLNELRGLAGTSSLPVFLANNLNNVASTLPTWAYAFIPAGVLSTLNLNTPTQTDVYAVNDKVSGVSKDMPQHTVSTTDNQETGGLGKILLPLIALLILGALIAMMLKSCNKTETAHIPPAPVASVAVASSSADSTSLLSPTLSFATTNDGKLLDGGLGAVGNDELKAKILSALSAVFGTDADKAMNININPAHDVTLPFADKLGEIFALVKGVPNATFSYVDGNILASAPDNQLAEKLVADIQALVPNMQVILSASQPKPPHTNLDEASVDFIDGHLNFYFATAKSEIGPNAFLHAKVILEEAKAGKKLGISGYTDSTGDADFNAKLSKDRAEAVKKFLMDNGVAESQLELIKPEDTIGAIGKDQEGRRVEVYVIDEATASTAK